MIKMQSLATDEHERLARCERIIERGFTVFVEVGQALAEIRDAKLYRAAHKTFEEYCKARWDIGRSRAYELIDQAKVSAALADAGVDLSATADISKRDVRTLKEDLPAAAAEIKSRVDKGEKVEEATKAVVISRQTEKEQAKAALAAQQAELDRQREEHVATLPDAIKQREQAKAEAIAARKRPPTHAEVDALHAEIEELREANAALEADVARLTAENKLYGEMKVQFQQGGFDKVIADKDEEIRVLETRLYSESQEKIKNLNTLTWAMKKLSELGWSRNVAIDIETGEIVDG